ncbi:MAG: hypothetical protein PQJ60_08290, partial [Spirochaetales bacterium]|nr:hypothetical protein [Spirochaetales bacterium]
MNLLENELYQTYSDHKPLPEDLIVINDCLTIKKMKTLINLIDYIPEPQKLKRKADLTLAVAKILSNRKLFEDFRNRLLPEEKTLLTEAVYNWGMNLYEDFPRLGLMDADQFNPYGNSLELPLGFLIDYQYSGGIFLEERLRSLLMRFLPAPLINVEMLSAPPEEYLYRFTAEEGLELFRNLNPLLSLLQDDGYFEREVDKAILKKTKQKIAQLSYFSPFIEKDEVPSERVDSDKEALKISESRETLMLKFLSTAFLPGEGLLPSAPTLPVEPLPFLKEQVARFLSQPYLETDMKYFIPHVSLNYKKDYMARNRVRRGNNLKELTVFLGDWPLDKFLSFPDFLRKLRGNGMPPPIKFEQDMYVGYSSGYDFYNSRERNYCYS